MPAKDLISPQPEATTAVGHFSPSLGAVKPAPLRKRFLIAAPILAAVAVAAFLYSRKAGTVEYATAVVDRGDIESTVTATGNCNAVVTVQVGSQVSGNIIALYADFNTKVKKGALVARIDPAPFQASVDQAKASLNTAKAAVLTAKATIAKSQSDLASAVANVASQKADVVKAQSAVELANAENQRRKNLVKDGSTSQEDADTAQANYDQAVASVNAAQAAVDAAEAAAESAKEEVSVAQTQLAQAAAVVEQDTAVLAQAQLNLDHTAILAPVDGTVVSRNMDVGQTVAASFQAPLIFLIAQDLTKMQVDTNVDESDVGPLRVGQQANFTVDAYPGMIFSGVVAQIREAPINVQNVVTYDAVVQVSNPDLKLFPGMTATVKIATGRSQQALRIPVAALRFRPPAGASRPAAKAPGGQPVQIVYTLDRGALQRVRVQLGITDGNYAQVLGGLTEGQPVVTGIGSQSAPPSQKTTGSQRVGF